MLPASSFTKEPFFESTRNNMLFMKMALSLSHCIVLLLGILLCSGTLVQATNKMLYTIQPSEFPERDVTTPTTTVPVVNPSTNPGTVGSNPTVTTNPTYSYPSYSTPPSPTTMTPITTPYTTPTPTTPYTTPTSTTPTTPTGSSGGQSWCIASQSASQTALQVALDYACGYGGADCSAIQQGGSCFNPDTVRDHASYAFNSYYQKNPVPTSCDFGGTAVLTSVDPSTGSCQYPSTSTSSSVLNTSNPVSSGSTVYGGYDEPPPSYSGTSTQNCVTLIIGLMCLIISSVSLNQN